MITVTIPYLLDQDRERIAEIHRLRAIAGLRVMTDAELMADVVWQGLKHELETRRIVAAAQQQRPFVLLKPRMYPDGDKWCALYGDDIQSGVAGFGDTPEEAARAFDTAWRNEKAKS